ncbi:adenylate kinase [Arthrobotrys musiformis]|uniref:Adenylate kinase n=1 Tax=Arthrobotrys musiformis TaxID=47236 RepID=A0AAV9W3D1_9PEZI
MSASNPKEAENTAPSSELTSASVRFQEPLASRGLDIVPIPGSVATNERDAILEAHSLMTTKQAYDLLRRLGVHRDIILNISQYGLDQPDGDNSGPSQSPSQEDKDVEELVSLLSQPGWENRYRKYIAANSGRRHSNPKLVPLTKPVHYNDLDASILRYAPHLRPENIVPPMESLLRQHPQTLQVSRDPKAKGFKDRDPSIVIIYIVGPPGSGKTEVAKALCRRFNFYYLGVAEILEREYKDPRSPYRDILEDMLPKGLLGPYKMVPSMLISEIAKEMSKGFKQVFVIDGFPRGLDRAQYFEKMVQPCDQVIEFLCDDEIAFNRMMKSTIPRMKQVNLEELEQTFNNRLRRHRREISIVTHYYRQLGKVMSVDAEVPFQGVMSQMELRLKDFIIDGFVGNRRESMDRAHRKAWKEMKKMVEKQFKNRAYSFSALAEKERYDPAVDDSGADEEVDDFEGGEEGEAGVQEQGEAERMDEDEDGGVPLDDEGSRFQQARRPLKALEVVPPYQPSTQTTPFQGPDNMFLQALHEMCDDKATRDAEIFTSNPSKSPGKAVKFSRMNNDVSLPLGLSSDELESEGNMRTKNAGKTPGPKQPQDFNRGSSASDEPRPRAHGGSKAPDPEPETVSTPTGISKCFKSIRRKISGTFSSSSESGPSPREKVKTKLSFSSLRRRKGGGSGEGPQGLGGMEL